MSSADASCHTVVFESPAEYPSAAELRTALEKGSDDVKFDTLRKIIISTMNGNPQARFLERILIHPAEEMKYSQLS